MTAITPTPLGEGKTTTTIGLGQGMRQHRPAGHRRHPPGVDGADLRHQGRRGGRRATARPAPFETLNLHLTGDMHAVTAAHNLLSAMVDNHLYHGNELGLDLGSITWRRVLDVNDRALRNIVDRPGDRPGRRAPPERLRHHRGLRGDGRPGPVHSLRDLRRRLGRIVVGFDTDGEPVTAEDLHGGRGHGGDHARRHQAQPAADAREHAGRSSTPGPSATSPTATPRWSPT